MLNSELLVYAVILLVVVVVSCSACLLLLRDNCPNYEDNYKFIQASVKNCTGFILLLSLVYVVIQLFSLVRG